MNAESPSSLPPVRVCPECGATREPGQQNCWLCLGQKEAMAAEAVDLIFVDDEPRQSTGAVYIGEDSSRVPRHQSLRASRRGWSHAILWALASGMCLVIGVGLAQFSLKYAVGFVFTTVPVTGLISIVSMFQERESKETAIVAGLIQGTVAFLTATLAVVGIIILTVIAILVAIVAALLEVCSSIMPNGTP